jgi:F0F1-type ATP synthase membrane subunit b/b'
MYSSFLQISLLVTFFLIGALSVTAARHAYAHFRPHQEEEKPRRLTSQPVHLPPEVKERLLQSAEVKFQTILNHSAAELEYDLKTTVSRLNVRLEKLGSEIVGDEMKRYRMDLDQLRKQTEANIGGAQTEINQHQTELKAKIDERRAELEAKMIEEVAAEKQILVQQVDTKLADAVASFLNETLGHNIDLGAQGAYLTAMLEKHKEEIVKGITDEV